MLSKNLALIAILLTSVHAYYETCQVGDRLGGCFDPGYCRQGGGTTVFGHCPGGADNVCCLSKCRHFKGKYTGSCRWTRDCGPSVVIYDGMCPGPGDFKCCVSVNDIGW